MNADPSVPQRCHSDRSRRQARRLVAVAMLVAVAGVGCAGPPDPSVSNPTSLASAPASWQPSSINWPPASLAPGAGVDHACVLSESQAEAILRRDVAAPEAREGAYDDLECWIPAPPESAIPPEVSILMAAPVGEYNANRWVDRRAGLSSGRRQLPTDQPAYFDKVEEDARVVFALGDRVVTLGWRATEEETDDELASMAFAFVEAISANWSGEE